MSMLEESREKETTESLVLILYLLFVTSPGVTTLAQDTARISLARYDKIVSARLAESAEQ